MKQNELHRKKIKRIASVVTAAVILFENLPLSSFSGIPKVIRELRNNYLIVKAAEYDVSKFTGNTQSLGQAELAEYSRCYANDSNFAREHQKDSITISLTDYLTLDNSYEPLGTSDRPFQGTIYISAYNTDKLLVAANRPLFNYVYDSVNIYKTGSTTPFQLAFVRTEDVQNGISPLLANYVVNDAGGNAEKWQIQLSNESAGGKSNIYSYSGVIGEIRDGAEITLDFTDTCNTRATIGNTGTEMGTRITTFGQDGTGILCGVISGNAVLKASYTDCSNAEEPIYIEAADSVGGLVGKMNSDENGSPTFELISASDLNIALRSTGNNSRAGLICGYIKGTKSHVPVVKLTDDLTLKGDISNVRDAGGLVGSIEYGDIIIGNDGTGKVALNDTTIKGTDCTGGAIGRFVTNTSTNSALTKAKYQLSGCTLGGGSVGGIAGNYDTQGVDNVCINVGNYIFSDSSISEGIFGGGVIGTYNSDEGTTVTGTFIPLSCSIGFGGVIGKYNNTGGLKPVLSIRDLYVNDINCTGNVTVGGVIQTVTGVSYISADNVNIVNAKGDQSLFGGIVGTLDNNNAGSFLDLTGNVTVSTNGNYNGGAIAGSFKNGVIRFAGTTDISGASPSVGYAHLVYENDNTLIYAKGSGSDSNWKLVRNTNPDSDLGMWGEVVRLFNGKNIEEASIVRTDMTEHTVTVATAETTITDKISFAKAALNMQLNDGNGNGHGALLFENQENLRCAEITIDGTNGAIDLSGTGLLGLMRDGGNEGYYHVNENSYKGDVIFFEGKITGNNDAEIKLNIGEKYGTYSNSELPETEKLGGKIYLSNKSGHNCPGLLSFTKGAEIENLKLTGSIEAIRQNAGDQLYLGSVAGFMTNGMKVNNVTIDTKIDAYKNHENGKFYIGGLVGLFDGTDSNDTFKLDINGSTLSPQIKLSGSNGAYSEENYNNKNIYAGGVLGLLGGKSETKYGAKIQNCKINPRIELGDDVKDTDNTYAGGFIGRIRENSTNERNVLIKNTQMTNASVTLKSKYSGGLLGCMWDRTNLEIDGLTISYSKVDNQRKSEAELSGLVYRGTGYWNIKNLTIKDSDFKSSQKGNSFGLIVNEAYKGNDGLYISLQNKDYTLTKITVPSVTFGDEIAAKTANSVENVLTNGNGTGVVSINMNSADESLTNIADLKNADGNVATAGTGTYQNKFVTPKYNSHSRYYYNLDVIADKITKDTVTGGEKFLAWSVYNYAAGNIKKYFNNNSNSIGTPTENKIDLSGLSYYPIDTKDVTLPAAVYTMDFTGIKNAEENINDTDSYLRTPDETTNINQHYLMQTGLFRKQTGTLSTSGEITLAGNYGYIKDVMNGALVGDISTGTIDLTKGITLNGLKPSDPSSVMLVNKIDGSGTNTPKLRITKLRATGYPSENTTAVATALINTAIGTNMEIVFKNIRLDARNGSNSNLTETASAAMNTAYRTTRSIFSNATFFNKLSADSTSTVEYYYTWEEDWGDADKDNIADRNVTYAKEITDTIIYRDEEDNKKSGENRYSGAKRWYTNPIDDTQRNEEFVFSTGFLPHVYETNVNTSTYPIYEVKVNYVIAGLTKGCGTYNDPYIIDSGLLLKKAAAYINSDSGMLDSIRLPNVINATWHDEAKGDSLYEKDGDNYKPVDSSDVNALGNGKWNKSNVRKYLAGAYYQITQNIELANDFPSISIGGTNENGENIFHGVIVGKQTTNAQGETVNPVITNNSGNPIIKISNGAVVKNVDLDVKASDISFSVGNLKMENYLLGYGRTNNEKALYYGGVIGEIMGGDNVIDNVNVKYENTKVSLTGEKGNTTPVGGYVGVIVNGGLFFRNMPDMSKYNVTGLSVGKDLMDDNANRALYVNPIVGRVINGYAVNEGSNKVNNGTKHYTIDNISKNPYTLLNVSLLEAKINIPDAQSLFVLSLITQSTAGVADSASGSYNEKCFSYGMANNNTYLVGVTHQGDYSSVGAVDTNGAIITNSSEVNDYDTRAKHDTALAEINSNGSYNYYARNTAVPYLIQNYTTGADARCVTTSAKNIYYTITLTGSDYDLSRFTSFRGIGCIGNANALYNMKLNTFDGKNNTITINAKLTRYGNNNDNYFYGCISSTVPSEYHKGINKEFTGYDKDDNLPKYSHGIGLFDHVTSKDTTNRSFYQNFTLKGSVQDLVYDVIDDNLKNNSPNKYAERFSSGGVLGFGYNKTYHTFTNITLDDLTVQCAYSSGGIVGLLANNQVNNIGIIIDKCQTGDTGISIIGGYHANINEARQGSGGLIGMNMKSKTTINQNLSETDKDTLYIVKIRQVTNDCPEGDDKVGRNTQDNAQRSNAGGIIGYGGVGVKMNNMKVVGVGNNPTIGSLTQTSNAAGMVAYAQNQSDGGTKSDITLTNCSVENISILANTNAGGLFSKSWEDGWAPSFCHFINCHVYGELSEDDEIQYGIETRSIVGYSGGFMASARAASNDANSYSNISNCYIKGYKIKAKNAGGMAGNVMNKPLHLTNSYIEDCIIDSTTVSGGFVSSVENNDAVSVLGYNLKTRNVKFTNENSGQFIGDGNNKNITLIGVAKYADNDKLNYIKATDVCQNDSEAFIVYADYTETNLTDTEESAGTSGFGSGSNSDMPKSPFVNVNPKGKMGTNEYITGDGAVQLNTSLSGYTDYTSGNSVALRIYADAIKDSRSNRAYSSVSGMDEYFKSKKAEDCYKISTWNTEMNAIAGVDDFTLLVVNDDNMDKTTELITKYIQLVTNTTKLYNEVSETTEYSIEINPCRYNAQSQKFEINTSNSCGLRHYKNYYGEFYQMDVNNADSAQINQFTLIDVQFKDPIESGKIAYHLYVPVLTKKTINVNFEASSITGSTYQSDLYKELITSEINAGKNGDKNPSTVVESMETWITTYIRYEYPKSEINELLKLNSDFMWNHDKQFVIERTFEDNIPENTDFILIDPNSGADKAYYAKASYFTLNGDGRSINLSDFTSGYNKTGSNFKENTLYSMINGKLKETQGNYYVTADEGTSGAVSFKMADGTTKWYKYDPENGTINLEVSDSIYEDYYLSMFVPKQEGRANVISIKPANTLSSVDSNGDLTTTNVIRATVKSNLNVVLILGDFFGHKITEFEVKPEDNIITETNKTLTTKQTVHIYLKNDRDQAAYFKSQLTNNSVTLYHSFNIILVKHETLQSQTDIIQGGLTQNNITATYQIDGEEKQHITPVRESNYVQLTTGNIKDKLLDSEGYSINIASEVTMMFPDYSSEFPPNPADVSGIGVQASVRSNIAYKENDLPYSRMNDKEGDTKFYYTKSQSNASLSFDAADQLDNESIGAATKNNSKLGVNGYYEYNNPLPALLRYNTADVSDYDNATAVRYTVQLKRKTTTDGKTEYKSVDKIEDYITDVTLTDTGGDTTLNKVEAESSDNVYVYQGAIDTKSEATKDKLFMADFSCNILNNSAFVKQEYANYRIEVTAQLVGATNNLTTAYIVYTNAKINPAVIPKN